MDVNVNSLLVLDKASIIEEGSRTAKGNDKLGKQAKMLSTCNKFKVLEAITEVDEVDSVSDKVFVEVNGYS